MEGVERSPNNGDTFERSCAHWSEAGRAGMEHFYALATEDYRQLATNFDWAFWMTDCERRVEGRGLRLLDVACGSGKFPSALHDHANIAAAGLKPIRYDLLDPSEFSLEEARGVLKPPFEPGKSHLCRLQDLERAALDYAVVWATHALYALPPIELEVGLKRFVEALAPGGSGFIAQACEDAHYLEFYRLYLETLKEANGTPYTSAEQIVHELERIGIRCDVRDISYEGRAHRGESHAVEGYLRRCLFDDTLSLEDMMRHDELGRYLRGCRTGEHWHFRQRVKMIFFSV